MSPRPLTDDEVRRDMQFYVGTLVRQAATSTPTRQNRCKEVRFRRAPTPSSTAVASAPEKSHRWSWSTKRCATMGRSERSIGRYDARCCSTRTAGSNWSASREPTPQDVRRLAPLSRRRRSTSFISRFTRCTGSAYQHRVGSIGVLDNVSGCSSRRWRSAFRRRQSWTSAFDPTLPRVVNRIACGLHRLDVRRRLSVRRCRGSRTQARQLRRRLRPHA